MSGFLIRGWLSVGARLGVVGLLLAATEVAFAEMRTWTFRQADKTLEGEIIGFTGKAVTLREPSGRIVSVPLANFSSSDRSYLAAERGKQWKEVEVAKLDIAGSGGRYKKCTVHGAEVSGEIFVAGLPRAVEAVLQERIKQAAPMVELSKQVESQRRDLQEAKAAAKAPRNRAYRREAAAERRDINVETSNLNALEARLAELQKAYDESVRKTKDKTMVKMRTTGLRYKELPIWECFDPRKPQ